MESDCQMVDGICLQNGYMEFDCTSGRWKLTVKRLDGIWLWKSWMESDCKTSRWNLRVKGVDGIWLSHSFGCFLNFRFFGKDLCIKWSKTQKYSFRLRKRVKIWKPTNYFLTQSCILNYFGILSTSTWF